MMGFQKCVLLVNSNAFYAHRFKLARAVGVIDLDLLVHCALQGNLMMVYLRIVNLVIINVQPV